jgi:hypothetical protein
MDGLVAPLRATVLPSKAIGLCRGEREQRSEVFVVALRLRAR